MRFWFRSTAVVEPLSKIIPIQPRKCEPPLARRKWGAQSGVVEGDPEFYWITPSFIPPITPPVRVTLSIRMLLAEALTTASNFTLSP